MLEEDVLSIRPKVLSDAQRAFYFENGYLLVPHVVPREVIDALNALTREWVDKSCAVTQSDDVFDLEPGHGPQSPRLRRLSSPVAQDRRYWDFASNSVVTDIVSDLLGPDVKFHHSKLNFKWAEGGEEVKWHQDIQYWPHTNYSPLTVGTYLHDVDDRQGPLGVIPGSHRGPLFNQYNDKEQWVGCLSDEDLESVDFGSAEYLTGPAGSITIHNCRTIHGSRPNHSGLGRPLLLNTYSSADAYPYTANPLHTEFHGAIVRGAPAAQARHDPRPCQIPPDWSGGYSSLFALQQEEDWATDR
ncbi:MAG: phytanoyl-CoA dioxygenase family protein [Pseudomonadota bacterium]